MEYFVLSALSVALTAAIGWPFAHLLLPKTLKRYSLSIAPVVGYCYIVFFGFLLYRLNLGSFNGYALFMGLPPLGLLVLLLGSGRIDLRRQDFLPAALSGLAYLASSAVYLIADGRAVAMGLGNLDIFNYAIAARYVQEFERDTKVGFFGQSGEFQWQMDMFWSGPPLFSAFLSAMLGSAPYKLQCISFAVMSAQTPVFVWLIARYALSLRAGVSAGVAVLAAVSPVALYVLWMGFGAQSIGVSLLLAAAFFFMTAMQKIDDRPYLLRCAALVVVMLCGIEISYYLLLPVYIAFLGIYLALLSAGHRSLRTFITGCVFLAATLAVTLALNPIRTVGLLSTMTSIAGNSSAGWFHIWLSPDRQLGLEVGPLVFDKPGSRLIRLVSVAAVAAASLFVGWSLFRRRSAEHFAFVFGLALPPILIGLALAVKGAEGGVLGGYQSFKATSCFFAFTLLALAIPFSLEASSRTWRRAIASTGAAAFAAVLCVNVYNIARTVSWARTTAYVMPPDMPEIQRVETLPFEGGVEITDAGNTELFWLQYFTLKRQEDFQRFPYGGRNVDQSHFPFTIQLDRETPGVLGVKKDSFDIFAVDPALSSGASPAPFRLTQDFSLARSQQALSLSAGAGFWDREAGYRWVGADGNHAMINVTNLSGNVVRAKFIAEILFKPAGDEFSFRLNGAPLAAVDHGPTGTAAAVLETVAFDLPTGRSTIEIVNKAPMWQSSNGDLRTFSFSVQLARLAAAN